MFGIVEEFPIQGDPGTSKGPPTSPKITSRHRISVFQGLCAVSQIGGAAVNRTSTRRVVLVCWFSTVCTYVTYVHNHHRMSRLQKQWVQRMPIRKPK